MVAYLLGSSLAVPGVIEGNGLVDTMLIPKMVLFLLALASTVASIFFFDATWTALGVSGVLCGLGGVVIESVLWSRIPPGKRGDWFRARKEEKKLKKTLGQDTGDATSTNPAPYQWKEPSSPSVAQSAAQQPGEKFTREREILSSLPISDLNHSEFFREMYDYDHDLFETVSKENLETYDLERMVPILGKFRARTKSRPAISSNTDLLVENGMLAATWSEKYQDRSVYRLSMWILRIGQDKYMYREGRF